MKRGFSVARISKTADAGSRPSSSLGGKTGRNVVRTSCPRLILLLLLVFQWLLLSAQKRDNDFIILRNGIEEEGKVNFVNKKTTSYISNGEVKSESNTNIYMIKYAKRDPVFFTREGEMFHAVFYRGRIPQKGVVIYLRDGGEFLARNVIFSEDRIFYSYYPTIGGDVARESILRKDIFMLRYADGTREILNEFDEEGPEENDSEEEEDDDAPDAESAQEIQPSVLDPDTQQKASEEKPQYADIKLRNGLTITKVIIVNNEGERVTYKKDARTSSPLLIQKKKDIANIVYY